MATSTPPPATTTTPQATPGQPGSGIIFVGKWLLQSDSSQVPENGVVFETGTAKAITGTTAPGRAEFYLQSDGTNHKYYHVRLLRLDNDPNYVRCFVLPQEDGVTSGTWLEFAPGQDVSADLPVASGSKAHMECVNIPPNTPVPTSTPIGTPTPTATKIPVQTLPKTGDTQTPLVLLFAGVFAVLALILSRLSLTR